MLFGAAVLAAGLLALAGSKSAWAELSGFKAAPNSPFAVVDAPTTVTNADFDGDGNVDLAAQNSGSNTVSVLLGNGEGTFDTKQDFTVGTNPSSVIGTDLDGDAKADLAVANWTSNTVSVLLGNGEGTFDTKQDFTVGTNPSSVVSSEFNGDGKTDLAVANYSSNTVSVLLGNGDGTFQTAQSYSVSVGGSPGPNQIITDDFDGDGDVDLATANVGPDTELVRYQGGVTVLLGNGDGTFQNASKVAREYLNYSLASADFDGDGDSDLVATSYGMTGGCCIYGEVTVALGNGDGTFGAARTFRVGSGHTGPSAVASADLDTDGHEDLVVSNSATDDVSVMLGNGDGTFGAAQNFPAGDLPAFVISPDLDADGIADLAVANQESDNVSVLLNTESQPPPPETTITKVPPDPDNNTSATFEFSSSQPGSTFQCALDVDDPSAYSPCTSPETVPEEGLLSEGRHTFYVKATGTAGNNTDPTPAHYDWMVDITAPAAPMISSPPEGGRVGSSFTVSGTAESNSTVQLSEGTASKGSATASGTGNWSILLSGITQGSHAYKAKATDTAGNTSAESNSRTVTVDTTAPDAPVITSPAEGARLKVSSLTIAGTAEANSTVEVFEATSSGDTSKGTTQVDASGAWTKTLSGVSDGSHTYKAKVKDATGNTSGFSNSRTLTVDTVKPEVSSTTSPTPLAGSTNVARGTNLTVTFSEKMRTSSIITPATTFKLFKVNPDGTQTQITDVVVSLSSDGLKATLNPFATKTTLLARNTKYKGVLTTGTKDLAGNSLAQQKSWTFTTKP